MVVLNREFYEVARSITSKISRLYNGKALPEINKVYLCEISSCSDTNLLSLYVYWSMLVQNVYNPDFKCMILTDTSGSESPIEMFEDIIDEIQGSKIVNFFDQDIPEIVDEPTVIKSIHVKPNTLKVKKVVNKPVLCIVSENCQNIKQMIDIVSPDLLIIDELKTGKQLLTEMISYLRTNPVLCTSVVVMTKFSIHQQVVRDLEPLEVVYKKSTCFQKIIDNRHTLYLNLMQINDDTDVGSKIESIVHTTQQLTDEEDLPRSQKKLLVVLKNRESSDKLVEHLTDTLSDSYRIFNGVDQKDIDQFVTPIKHDNELPRMLCVAGTDIIDTLEMNDSTLKNIDSVLIFDKNLNKDVYIYDRVISSLVSNSNRNSSLLFAEVLERNLHTHLYRLAKIFYDDNATNIQVFNEIVDNINTQRIYLDVEFTDVRRDKLERTFKITESDKRFNIRHNLIKIITIPRSKASTLRHLYEDEEDLIKSDLGRNELMEELNLITNAKKGAKNIPHYSGPKWVSSPEKDELPGSSIGFAHEDSDTIEICEVLGIKGYTRREKRKEWKEKDCKDKNVLFLSPLKGVYKLSKFKKQFKIPQKEKIENLREFELDLDANL